LVNVHGLGGDDLQKSVGWWPVVEDLRLMIHRKCIYNFLCSMLVLHQLLCVLFILCSIFYIFSETNLLTRCHSASSYFLLFLCFRKVTQEIFSELDKTKAEVPIYLKGRRSPEERRRGARGQPHHRVARATPGRTTRWCGPLVHPLTSLFRL
jgi:hypothetical protein